MHNKLYYVDFNAFSLQEIDFFIKRYAQNLSLESISSSMRIEKTRLYQIKKKVEDYVRAAYRREKISNPTAPVPRPVEDEEAPEVKELISLYEEKIGKKVGDKFKFKNNFHRLKETVYRTACLQDLPMKEGILYLCGACLYDFKKVATIVPIEEIVKSGKVKFDKVLPGELGVVEFRKIRVVLIETQKTDSGFFMNYMKKKADSEESTMYLCFTSQK